MKKIVNLVTMFLMICFVLQGTASADSCASVEREMVQGQMAVEIAKDQSGFQTAAGLFEKATEKAPLCADAYYNLGLVYEKAANYDKAIIALNKYLQLNPEAEDAGDVRKKTYQLEFLITNNETQKRQKEDQLRWLAETVAGTWNAWCDPHNGNIYTYVYKFTVLDDRVNYSYVLPGAGRIVGHRDGGMKYDFENNRFLSAQGFELNEDYTYVRSNKVMERVEKSGHVRCRFERK